MSKTFDLSTLGLSAGTHEITVKARASGYLDSAPSNAVSYVVAEETTYKLSGTWKFNETVYCEMVDETVAFTSNGETFSRIYTDDSAGGVIEYDSTTVYYRSEKWTGYEAYRTITFDGEQTVSQEFYDWFTGEAVKQYIPTDGLAYELSSDGTYYTCTGIGTATNTDIVIASEINGIPVTTIGASAFVDNKEIVSVKIPENVTSIGGEAFGWSGLTKVVLPDSLKTIGSWAFASTPLTEIVIPYGVTRINSDAFYNCDDLTKIIIPESVTYIGETAFCNCKSLTIYCRVESKPNGWHTDWAHGCPVVWWYSGQ